MFRQGKMNREGPAANSHLVEQLSGRGDASARGGIYSLASPMWGKCSVLNLGATYLGGSSHSKQVSSGQMWDVCHSRGWLGGRGKLARVTFM